MSDRDRRARDELSRLGFDADQVDDRLVERVADHLDAPQRLREVLDREARGEPAAEYEMGVAGLSSHEAQRTLMNRRYEVRGLARRVGEEAARERAAEALDELLGFLPGKPPTSDIQESPRKLAAQAKGEEPDGDAEPDESDPRSLADHLRRW